MRQSIVFAWNYVFDHEVSPLRNIPDISTRHYVLQMLGIMWAVAFSAALGSYTILAASVIGHVILIGAVAITVITYSIAANNPRAFLRGAGRRLDGEHE